MKCGNVESYDSRKSFQDKKGSRGFNIRKEDPSLVKLKDKDGSLSNILYYHVTWMNIQNQHKWISTFIMLPAILAR